MDEKKKELMLQIDIDDVTAQGVYSNFAVVNHTETEFVIDFVYLQPMQPKAKVRGRVISSPRQVRKLIEALEENLARYEDKFGSAESDPSGEELKGIIH